MGDKVGLVDYEESLSIKVGKFLLSKGFALATCGGLATNSLDETHLLGILHKDPEAKPRKYLLGLITRERRRGFLGTLWFAGLQGRKASERNWVFEVHGRKNVELARKLAEEMSSTFNVKITLRLVRDQPDFEIYISD